MNKSLLSLLFLTAILVPKLGGAAVSDKLVIQDAAGGVVTLTATEGGDDRLVGTSAELNNRSFFIGLTEPGTDIISDFIFAPGSPPGQNAVVFDSDPGTTPIGQHCSAGTLACLEETGDLQDITALIVAQIGAFTGRIMVQSDVVEETSAPEPASLALLGIGLAGLGFSRRGRAR